MQLTCGRQFVDVRFKFALAVVRCLMSVTVHFEVAIARSARMPECTHFRRALRHCARQLADKVEIEARGVRVLVDADTVRWHVVTLIR